jgi:hypothetical protein
MHFYHSLLFMFITSFVIQYYVMSFIMTNKSEYFTNSYGKMYIAIVMSLLMLLSEVYMHDSTYNVFSYKLYLLFLSLSVIFVYLYRTQAFIYDKQYLEEMIEHHSMALLTSNKILEKTKRYDVANLAKNIIQTQTDEIDIMNNILKKLDI